MQLLSKNPDEHVHAAYTALLRTPLAIQNLTDDDVEMLAEVCGNAGSETFIVANNPVHDHTPPTATTTTRVTLLSPPPQLSPSSPQLSPSSPPNCRVNLAQPDRPLQQNLYLYLFSGLREAYRASTSAVRTLSVPSIGRDVVLAEQQCVGPLALH